MQIKSVDVALHELKKIGKEQILFDLKVYKKHPEEGLVIPSFPCRAIKDGEITAINFPFYYIVLQDMLENGETLQNALNILKTCKSYQFKTKLIEVI